jgi:hypothetical protein
MLDERGPRDIQRRSPPAAFLPKEFIHFVTVAGAPGRGIKVRQPVMSSNCH